MTSQPKAVFLIPVLGEFAHRGDALTANDWHVLSRLADNLGVDAHAVFAVQDGQYAGNAKSLTVTAMRAERERVLFEIREHNPDFIACFGPVALMCALSKGNQPLANYLRRSFEFVDLPGVPTYATQSLEMVRANPGAEKWLTLDLRAALDGYTETKWGEYVVLSPDDPAWHVCPDPAFAAGGSGMVGFDLETYPSLDPWHAEARIRMAVVSAAPGKAWVVQLGRDSRLPEWLATLCADDAVVKCGSNIKYDMRWLARFGYECNNVWDTSTAEHVLDETDPFKDLKSLTFRYLPRLADYSAGHRALVAERGSWAAVEDDEQYDYAGADGEASIAAALGQRRKLAEGPECLRRAHRVLLDLYPVLASMETRGVCIDTAENTRLDAAFSSELDDVRERICTQLGPINPNSPAQLADALVERVPGIDLRKHQIKRQLSATYYRLPDDDEESYSTQRAVLEREAAKHPVIEDVLLWRRLQKLHGTYVRGLADKHLTPHPDRQCYVHTSYRTDVVETYRLSSQGPNLQNIPKKPEPGDKHPIPEHLNIKNQFKSRFPGGSFLEADLSQAEIRVAATLSGDERMLDAIHSGADLHRELASKMLRKPVDQVTDLERHNCKRLTFLVLYGGGANTLSAQLGITKDAAGALIDQYFDTFHALHDYINRVKIRVKRDLYSESVFGFRRRFVAPANWNTWDGWRVERMAWNFQVQNVAAAITYVAMMDFEKSLRANKLRSMLITQVHDSLGVDVYPGEEEQVASLAVLALTRPNLRRYDAQIGIELAADVAIGERWGTTKPLGS